MAQALNRAADHFEVRARAIDLQVAHWRKDRPRDPSPIVPKTFHGVVLQLRSWAAQCSSGPPA